MGTASVAKGYLEQQAPQQVLNISNNVVVSTGEFVQVTVHRTEGKCIGLNMKFEHQTTPSDTNLLSNVRIVSIRPGSAADEVLLSQPVVVS